ncbi:hypothetical protein CO608_07955 [Lysobacteraceae bacterium NML08-0793]|nr:hypothetical protein CO608_07955 [Xanthomonadaceae bacterium NML08-0793]
MSTPAQLVERFLAEMLDWEEHMHRIKALLPQSKFDSAPLPALAALDDVQFTQAGPELLTWLQDENYPIFHEVLALLAQRQACIVPALEAVFHTQDWIWQHAVLQHLYPRLTPQNQALLLPQIRQLAQKPQPMDEDALALQALAARILRGESTYQTSTTL